ncbi:MAG: penicillin-binding protein 1A [Gammaproteobacteria bacterium]|nr:penicillin-binding protein 1A [Gammaproteobacteria bacterium]
MGTFFAVVAKGLLGALFAGLTASLIGLVGLYVYLSPSLPSVDRLREVQLQEPLRVYSKEGVLIAEYGNKRRIPLKIETTPQRLIDAFLASEDDRFYEHPGVDYQGILRAVAHLIKTGKKGQGGSTITMQVARNFFLSSEKTYLRKINEIFLSFKIEQELEKNEILELYFNKIFLGHRSYGVAAAAQVYYGKTLSDLSLAEMAMIAGLPKAPSRYNPITNPKRAVVRRNYVLGRMLTLEKISQTDFDEAKARPVTAQRHQAPSDLEAGYVGEMVRNWVSKNYGKKEVYSQGFRVYTTINAEQQRVATWALRKNLLAYEERHGYIGAVTQLSAEQLQEPNGIELALAARPHFEKILPVVVTAVEKEAVSIQFQTGHSAELKMKGMKWARKRLRRGRGPSPKKPADVVAVGDLIYVYANQEGEYRLAQLPKVEGAMVALNPKNGAIQILLGGFEFQRSKFNRVMQAWRQPGSNFKPFIYSSALEKGYTAATLINDAPVVVNDSALEGAWRPENYSGKFFGPTRLRWALAKSRNLVSIRILRAIGVDYALNYVERFGFERKDLPRNLSLALGSASVTPIQLATAYATFANGGFKVEPYFIERIEDAHGEVIYRADPAVVCLPCEKEAAKRASAQAAGESIEAAVLDEIESNESEPKPNYAPRVIEARNAFIMRTILQDVVRYGTAVRAKVLNRRDLGGKTGTTNDQHDAWFSGFNSHLVVTAWVGFDKHIPLGAKETGGRAALPMWIEYMRFALKGVKEDRLLEPDGMVTMLIDAETGGLAGASARKTLFEHFRSEYAPHAQAENDEVSVPMGAARLDESQELQEEELF